ncbi:MAG: hypothetical protein A3C35_04410 [Omnitrophica bacterium RIFCSPHIGHO2_02_FULL_46_11]|nr:MAG: hypothetical protein A3A81_06495 [Omnitrophica bacterium RIFCSPLOWO2_01_FULL_45_10b]OGW87289.1 MAG: hypothetical protein A3C35_04410 [Omnitrophica bacterium RIFCSPHIGHO2_02_FULL_46_11]
MKRSVWLCLMVMMVGCLVLANSAPVRAEGNELVIGDFNTGDKPNNIGGDFGSWDKDPNDETQSSQISFEAEDALGDKAGYSLRLDYDVDSPNPAYNGFWMKLNDLDATAYNTVNFYMKGDDEAGYTKRVKIELKDSSKQPSPYIVAGLTDQWQKFSIPFDKFKRVQNWNALSEFVVVFDDINSNPKSGTIFLDHVTFSSE